MLAALVSNETAGMGGTLKERVKAGVRAIAYLTGWSRRKARSQRCVRLLMFHEVGGPDYPLEVFERQLHYLARHFAVSPLPQAISRLRNNSILGNEVVLTFDDGHESHATLVYPVLERLQLPASFFVCPGLIETGEGIWTLETRAALRSLSATSVQEWLRDVGGADAEGQDGILEWMKGLPSQRRREIASHLRRVVESKAGEGRRFPAQPLMSWKQLRGLDPKLVAIGSHSLTHPTLPLLGQADLEREVRESQRLLEERLDRPCRFFCYPDGAFDARVVDVARRHYEAAITTVEGFAWPGDDLYTLRRIPAAPSRSLLAWRLHRPRDMPGSALSGAVSP